MQCICKRNIKMKNNAVQNKNTMSRVYCLSRSFEHIFPTILKTVHPDKSSSNKQLTVSINHKRAMHSPKLFSALPLIQSNTYYETKKCIPEILLDIIMYNSYISLSYISRVIELKSLLKFCCFITWFKNCKLLQM